MRALAIVAALLFSIAPAYAQKKTDEQKKADAARQAQEDQAYKSSLQRIQAKDSANADPWGSVRSDNTSPNKPKTPASPAR